MPRSFRIAVVLATALMILAPVGLVVYQSFLSGPFFQPSSTFTTQAYAFVLFEEDDFREAFVNSAIIAAGMTAIAVPLGCIMAFLLVRTDLPGRRLIEPLVLVPMFVSSVVLAFGFVVALGPWRETVAFGQINVVLFGLIMADFMINRKRWPTGLLIGIAAGIKLTPLVFGLYFLATGNWRGLRNMALGFVGTIAFGFLVLPKESIAYWLQLLPDTSRIGGAGYVDNLSVKGAILHFFGPDFAVNAPWLIIGILLAAMTFLTVRRSARQGEPMTGIAATALLMLLISPISWSHHWVWVALFFPVLIRNIADLPAQARVLRATGLGLVLLAVPIFMFSPKTIGALFGSENLNSQIPTVWLMASSVGVFWGLAAVLWWLLASRLKPVRRELPASGAELAQLRQRAD